jgi:flagellar biosynthetic protein FlhB
MADERDDNERTEDPTPRRLEEALKRGDVVKSAEVNTWFMIAAGTLILIVFAAPMAASLQTTLRGVLANSGRIAMDAPALAALAKSLALSAVTGLAIPLLLLCLAALAGNVVQHRILLSPPSDPAFRGFRLPPACPACSRARRSPISPRVSPSSPSSAR